MSFPCQGGRGSAGGQTPKPAQEPPSTRSQAALGLPPVAGAGSVGTCGRQAGGRGAAAPVLAAGCAQAWGAGEEIRDSTWILLLNGDHDPSAATPSLPRSCKDEDLAIGSTDLQVLRSYNLANVYVQVRAVTHFPYPEAFAKSKVDTPRKYTQRLGKDVTRTNEMLS